MRHACSFKRQRRHSGTLMAQLRPNSSQNISCHCVHQPSRPSSKSSVPHLQVRFCQSYYCFEGVVCLHIKALKAYL